MDNIDLYELLELKSNAEPNDIKKNFKRLALKFHPDKNKSKDANEKFNQIRVAYEILSDNDKKFKYDNMIQSKKIQFTDTIFHFLKEITNPKTIHNMISRPDIINDIKNGNIDKIAQKLIQKILDNFDLDIDMTKLNEIFIHSPTVRDEEKSDYSTQEILNTSECNTLNIFGNVKTNLDDIYHNRLKEIIIKRKVYNQNNEISIETNQYYIPLYDNKVTISNAGDKIINSKCGDVILKISCKKDPHFIRNNYDIIYNDTITLHELFYGFKKNINCFGTNIDICSSNPLEEYYFNGNLITISLKSKGLPYDSDSNRGNLIINLYLNKSNDFENNIKMI